MKQSLSDRDLGKVRPLFSGRAVFSDETALFREPEEAEAGQEVRVRIRTLSGNADRVFVEYAKEGTYGETEAQIAWSENGFDYFEGSFSLSEGENTYIFRIEREERRIFYGRAGLVLTAEEAVPFLYTAGAHIPEWARGAVMYQIFPDRFYNGDPDNDVEEGEFHYIAQNVKKIRNWKRPLRALDVHRFYGGDLAGIIDKLDYLADLGVEVLYLNPIFVAPSNHKYDTQDYDHIDPHLGKIVNDGGRLLCPAESDNALAERYILRTTDPENLAASDALFAELVRKAHEKGIRILLDGVFNHSGSFHKWFDAEKIYAKDGESMGAYQRADSPYRSYYRFTDENGWPKNDSCEYWWDNKTLPKLNYEGSEELEKEIFRIAKKWLSAPYHIDGWRADVAADLGHSPEYNHSFWEKFRKEVRSVQPEALILAEHYGDPSSYLRGNEWDTVMNYDAFMDPLSYFLTGMEKHSDRSRDDLLGDGEAFFASMRVSMAMFGTRSLQSAMNELSNHDHSRFLTRTNRRIGRLMTLGAHAAEEDISYPVMRIAVLIQMTWIGAPTIYYGDEAGVCGWTDPDSRRTYPWGNENKELLSFYKEAIKLHRAYSALRTGSIKELGAGRNYIAYGRFTEKEQLICAVNIGIKEREAVIPVWETGLYRDRGHTLTRILSTNRDGVDAEKVSFRAEDGVLRIRLKPEEAAVFLHEKDTNRG